MMTDTMNLLEALGDIEVLTRPNDAEKQGAIVHRDELLNDIGKIARATIADVREGALRKCQEEKVDLFYALEKLRDEQNGPPLLQYAKQWQAAFDKANDVLTKYNPQTK